MRSTSKADSGPTRLGGLSDGSNVFVFGIKSWAVIAQMMEVSYVYGGVEKEEGEVHEGLGDTGCASRGEMKVNSGRTELESDTTCDRLASEGTTSPVKSTSS